MATGRTKEERERVNTLAGRQRGAARLVGPLLGLVFLALPVSWHLPLFRTELLVFLENEVTLVGAVRTLAETDLFLCAIVILFGMAIPLLKLVALLFAWYALPEGRALPWIGAIGKIGKFSMLDVLLVALVIVGLKGVGMGKVSIAYGLYVYAAVVIASLLLASLMQALAARAAPDVPV